MSKTWLGFLLGLFLGIAPLSCQPAQSQVGTNTNWMQLCNEDVECGSELSCECGRCTLPCAATSSCPDGSTCSPLLSARLQCGGEETGTCQPSCTQSEDCQTGRLCLAGVCVDALLPLECPPEALYCEDFEQGLGEVTEVVTDGNTLTTARTATPSGTNAALVHVADGPSVAYARAPLPTQSPGTLFVSGWVRVPEQEAHNVAPLALWSAAEEAWALRLVLVDARAEVWSYTAPVTSSVQLEAGSWHCLQMQVDVSEAPGGSVSLSVDGTEVENATGLDTLPDGGIGAVAVGSLWAASAADLAVDRVVVSTEPIDCFR
jgi:hypothetical protein